MTRQELREQARSEYALDGATDDPFFSDTVMDALIDRAHRWFARRTRIYRTEITTNLTLGSGGLSTVNLGGTVFELDTRPGLVRVLAGGSWRQLRLRSEDDLRGSVGALENAGNGTPTYYFLRTADTEGSYLQMCCYPGSSAEVTNGLKYAGYTLPAALVDDDDSPALPAGEDDQLVTVIHWLMAEMESTRGRPGAGPDLIARYRGLAEQAAVELRRTAEQIRRGGPRRVRPAPY